MAIRCQASGHRRLIVSATLIGFAAQSLGCSTTRSARGPATATVPVLTEVAEVPDPLPMPDAPDPGAPVVPESEAEPARPSAQVAHEGDAAARRKFWHRRWFMPSTATKKALQRGAYAAGQGAAELAQVAGVAAFFTIAAGTFGALVFLSMCGDDD